MKKKNLLISLLFVFYVVHYFSSAAFPVKQRCNYLTSKTSLFLPEMFCGCNRPAGGDGASRGCRERLRRGVLDAAAENRVQDASREDPQRPHTPGAVQTGENIQVYLQGCFFFFFLIPAKKKRTRKKPDYCYTQSIYSPSLGTLMQMNLLLYCVFFFFSRHQQLTKLLSRYINDPLYHKPRESNGKKLKETTVK